MKKTLFILCLLLVFSRPVSGAMNKIWTYASDLPASSMVCYGSRLFIAYPDGNVCALSIDPGVLFWRKKLKGHGPVQLSVYADTLVALRDQTVSVQNGTTGVVERTFELPVSGKTIVLMPEILYGRMLLEVDGTSVVLDVQTEKVIYQSSGPMLYGKPACVFANENWRSGLDENRHRWHFVNGEKIVAFDLKLGQEVWSRPCNLALFGVTTKYKDVIYAAAPNGLFAVDDEDGSPLFTSRLRNMTITSPYLHFVTKRGMTFWDLLTKTDRITIEVQQGIALHACRRGTTSGGVYRIPDIARLMFTYRHNYYFTYSYISTDDQQWHSMVMMQSDKSKQVYGRNDVLGKSTGMFVKGRHRIYPELSPGVLYEVTKKQALLTSSVKLSGSPFLAMCLSGKRVVVATAEGDVIGLSSK